MASPDAVSCRPRIHRATTYFQYPFAADACTTPYYTAFHELHEMLYLKRFKKGWDAVMLREPRPITVEPDSELGQLLDEASERPLILARNGVRYRLSVEDDPWANYDPEAVRKAVRTIAGSITPEEGERLKAELYRAREEGTRPMDRP